LPGGIRGNSEQRQFVSIIAPFPAHPKLAPPPARSNYLLACHGEERPSD